MKHFILVMLLSLGIVQMYNVQAMRDTQMPSTSELLIKSALTLAGTYCTSNALIHDISFFRTVRAVKNLSQAEIDEWPRWISDKQLAPRLMVFGSAFTLVVMATGALTCRLGCSLIRDLKKRFSH